MLALQEGFGPRRIIARPMSPRDPFALDLQISEISEIRYKINKGGQSSLELTYPESGKMSRSESLLFQQQPGGTRGLANPYPFIHTAAFFAPSLLMTPAARINGTEPASLSPTSKIFSASAIIFFA